VVNDCERLDQLLTLLPPHYGGLMPVANGLFHRWPGVRENALELLTTIQLYPVSDKSRLELTPGRPSIRRDDELFPPENIPPSPGTSGNHDPTAKRTDRPDADGSGIRLVSSTQCPCVASGLTGNGSWEGDEHTLRSWERIE